MEYTGEQFIISLRILNELTLEWIIHYKQTDTLEHDTKCKENYLKYQLHLKWWNQ